jgi:hypothetical protein
METFVRRGKSRFLNAAPTILIGGKEQQLVKLEKKIYEFYSANVRTFTTLMKKLTEQTKDI